MSCAMRHIANRALGAPATRPEGEVIDGDGVLSHALRCNSRTARGLWCLCTGDGVVRFLQVARCSRVPSARSAGAFSISLGSGLSWYRSGHLQDEFPETLCLPAACHTETCCCEPEFRHHTAHNQISKVIDNMNTAAVTNEATIPIRTAFVVDTGLPPWKWRWGTCNRERKT